MRVPNRTASFQLYRRSRVFHAHIAQKLKKEEITVRARATKNILMLREANLSEEAVGILNAWEKALSYPLYVLVKILVSGTTTGEKMRKLSPFMGVLTPMERSAILRRLIAKEHETAHKRLNKGYK